MLYNRYLMRYLTKRNRAILRAMVITDFKVRYQGSVLGYLWSLLKPLFMFAILYAVFTQVFNIGDNVEHFPVYLLLGIVLWNFFMEATSSGLGSIVASGDLIRKISIPRYLIVVSSSVSALINLGLNMVVVGGFALFNGLHPHLGWLLMPFIILELYILAQAVAFFLSALYVRFRDVSYIWELLMQAGFYATPILYPMTYTSTPVPESIQSILLLNPVAQIIQDARYVFVTDTTMTIWNRLDSLWIFFPMLVIAILVVVAITYFKRQSKTFAEEI